MRLFWIKACMTRHMPLLLSALISESHTSISSSPWSEISSSSLLRDVPECSWVLVEDSPSPSLLLGMDSGSRKGIQTLNSLPYVSRVLFASVVFEREKWLHLVAAVVIRAWTGRPDVDSVGWQKADEKNYFVILPLDFMAQFTYLIFPYFWPRECGFTLSQINS